MAREQVLRFAQDDILPHSAVLAHRSQHAIHRHGVDAKVVRPSRRFRSEQRVGDGGLGRLRCGLEQRRNSVVGIRSDVMESEDHVPGFAVENAMKMSPEPLPPKPPWRPMPSDTRVARRLS